MDSKTYPDISSYVNVVKSLFINDNPLITKLNSIQDFSLNLKATYGHLSQKYNTESRKHCVGHQEKGLLAKDMANKVTLI